MEFGLTEEQEILRDSARRLLARVCPPERVRSEWENPGDDAKDLWTAVTEAGWSGLLVPERFGGLGLGWLDLVVVLTECGRAALPIPFAASAGVATGLVAEFGSAALRKRWMPALACGESTATIAVAEAEDGTFAADSVRTAARKHRGRIRIRCRKLFVPGGDVADFFLVIAATAREGWVAVPVERERARIRSRPLDNEDRSRRLWELEIDAGDIAPGDVLRTKSATRSLRDRLIDLNAVATAADSLGGAETCLERSVEYAKVRRQFGRPIGSFQAVQHMAADMVAGIEPARALLWWAAHTLDTDRRSSTRAASMARLSLGDVGARVGRAAVEIHGGIGFTWENDLHFWFKRLKANDLAAGGRSFYRDRVAATSGF